MADVTRDIKISVRTTRDEGPRKSVERVDELGDHATKTTARLIGLSKAGDRVSRSMTKMAVATAGAGAAMKAFNGNGKTLERMMFRIHKQMVAFGGMLIKGLLFGLKAATVALGAMSVALVGIHALFITGRFLVKAYQVALKGLAATAAGTTVAIGLASAAIREQQAAMFAYTGRNNKEFGSGLNQTRVNMRGLHMDAQLAGAGVEALNKAFGVFAKSKTGYMASSKNLLKGLGDFAAAGQPLEEGLSKAAEVVVALQDPKKGLGAVQTAFKALGPAAEEALKQAKKAGIDTKEEFIAAMQSGQLSIFGGVKGQFDAVNNTLIGQLKKYFNLVRGQFADFGQQFLPEAKYGLERMYRIFTRTMQMTSGAIAGWEKRGGFVDALVNATQKVSDFYLKLIRDWLPASVGMFKRLGEWWDKFKEGWNEVVDGLRGFQDGARVIEKSFGNAWRPVWNEIKTSTKNFNETLQRSAPLFERFGSSLGNVIEKLLTVLRVFQKVITDNLPFISRVFDGLASIFKQFVDTFNYLSDNLFGGLGSRGAMFAMLGMAKGLKTTRGTLVDTQAVKQMNVQAGSVSIMGGIKGAMTGAKIGANPALATATGGLSIPGGAVIGGLAGSGLLGGKVQNWWNKLATPIAAVASPAGAATAAAGAAASALPRVSPSVSAGSSRAATTPGSTSVSGSFTAAARSARSVSHSLNTQNNATGRVVKGLNSFNRALGSASRTARLASGGAGGGGAYMASGAPGGTVLSGRRHSITSGSPAAAAGKFSLLSRGMAKLGGYGKQQAAMADRRAAGTGMKGLDGGMIPMLMAMGLAKLSDNAMFSKDIAGGLSLAATMAMFSPRLAMGVAGGTFAMKSSDVGAAVGGGALAGGVLGGQFGKTGAIIGTAIGSIVGFIRAPMNEMNQVKDQSKKIVKDFFDSTSGEMMVQLALLENAAYKSGKRETTIDDSLRKRFEQRRKMANLARQGAKGGGPKDTQRGFMDYVGGFGMTGAGIGGITGAIVAGAPSAGFGVPLGIAAGSAIGFAAGATTGAIAYGTDRLHQLIFNRKDPRRRKERGEAINAIYAAGGMTNEQYKALTGRKKNTFLGIDRLKKDQPVNDQLQQQYLNELEKRATAEYTEGIKIEQTMSARIKLMSRSFGIAETDIVRLAQTMGVNLADNTRDLNEIMKELGLTTIRTAEQIDQAISEIMINNLSVFDQAIKQEKAPFILDEAIKNLRQDFDNRTNKKLNAEDAKLIFGTYSEQLTNMYGGDATSAYFEMMRQVGSAGGLAFLKTNPLTGKKNPLGGFGTQLFGSGPAAQATQQYLINLQKGVTDTAARDIGAVLAAGGQGFSSAADMQRFKQEFATLSIDEQKSLVDQLSTGTVGTSGEKFLASFGMNFDLKDLQADEQAFAMETDLLQKESILLEAQRTVIADMGKFFAPGAERPEWWSAEKLKEVFVAAGVEVNGDTSTPRGRRVGDTTSSRLSQTLARHDAMNSMVSGKRMITSSYRTNGLGSLNSDHITGRAYDLVGNQLGMYKTVVEKNGGFAEYHGGAINRHLHVVPGPGVNAPMGDSTVPYNAAPVRSQTSVTPVSDGGITVNLNVNGVGIKDAIPQIKAELERSLYEYKNRR